MSLATTPFQKSSSTPLSIRQVIGETELGKECTRECAAFILGSHRPRVQGVSDFMEEDTCDIRSVAKNGDVISAITSTQGTVV